MDKKVLSLGQKLKELLESKLGKVELIIYGSRARGDYSPDSDLDVCVIVEQVDAGVRRVVSELCWEVGFSSGIVIVPVIFSQKELKGPLGDSPLYHKVRQEGIRL